MFKTLKSFILAAFITSLFAFSQSAHAADLHAVLVGDTTDDSLGTAFEKDLEYMQEKLKKIAKNTNLNLNITLLQGNSVTPKKVLRQIESLQVNPDDVVVLYFTIHGFRASSKASQWPSLYFGVSQQGVDFEAINEVVKNKNPRLLLSIADSCNNKIEWYVPMVMPKLFNYIQASPKSAKANFRKLFLESKGSIVISASTPGQFSWYYGDTGGIYTMKFLETLEECVQMDAGMDWSVLLDITNLKVVNETNKFSEVQTPQYELDLSK